ncbi:hypothetical protein LUZ60_011564 [Juncus effusus]|nr:hypothetical protein LUZ60_011564 [Juncus effusus]
MEKKTANTPPILPSSPPGPGPQYTTPPGPGPQQFTTPPSQQFRSPPVQFTTPPGPSPQQFTPRPGPGLQQFTPPPGHGPQQFTPGSGPQQFTPPPGPGPQQFTPALGPQQQFSTPPGPPVFSSPLRAPLRPSPYGPGPQSSSLYSGGFSNGSQELPVSQTVLARDLDLGFESPFVRFSAHKVLKRKKQANIPSLPFGAIVSPGRVIQHGPDIIERDPLRCHNCGAFSNLFCEIQFQTGQWNCAICNYSNSSEGHYICNSQQDLSLYPELATSAVDYVLHSNNRRSGFVSVGDVARSSGPIFVLIDECLDEPHLQHLQGSLHAFVDSLSPTQRVGFLTFGRTVSIYDFSEGSVVSADTVPGEKSPTQETLKPLIYGTGLYLSHMHASLPVAHIIISSLRPYRLPVPESLRDRCLATAVETALGLIRGPTAEINQGIIRKSSGNCTILACLGGPCTFGPGLVPGSTSHPNYAYLEKNSVKYMEKLGFEARKCGTVIDLLCAGTCPVRVSILQSLVRESGGVLILHDDFGETFGVNLQRASTRSSGSNGSFEIRCSDEFLVTQVIGPGEESESQPDPHENFKNDNSLTLEMNTVEQTQSFTISFEHKKDLKSEFIHFQFSVRFSTSYQSEISRVITLRVPTTDSLSSYLSSIQSATSSIIISKFITLDATTSKLCSTLKKSSIDERIKDISHKFGSHKFPKEIADIP